MNGWLRMALVALALGAACTRGQVVTAPPADATPLATAAVVEWDHAWLDRLTAVAPQLLAARFPAAQVTLDTLLLDDGAGVTTAKVAPLSLAFPAVDLQWMDALGQGLGVRVAYGEGAADVQLTTAEGVCAARATFPAMTVHLTFAFDPAASPAPGGAPLGALVPVGVPTLVGALPPVLTPTACPAGLPAGVLDDLAAVLQQEVRQRVAALQLGVVQEVANEVFAPWSAAGVRFAALGADAAPLTWGLQLGPGSSAWRREVRLSVLGGDGAAAALTVTTGEPAPRPTDCLVRLTLPVDLLGQVLGELAGRGALADEALLDVTLSERPAWLPATPGLRVTPPFRVVAAPLALTALDVAAVPAASDGTASAGVRLDAAGTWRLRVYAAVEGSELLLGRARLTGSVRVRVSAADGLLRAKASPQGAFDDVAAPVVPLADGWTEAALAAWGGAIVSDQLGAFVTLVPPAPAVLATPRLSALTLTEAGVEACFAPFEETP